jgi:hypothetical protein
MDANSITDINYAVAGHYDSDHVGGLDNLVLLTGGNPDTGYSPHVGTVAFYDRGGSQRQDGTAITPAYYDLVVASGRRATAKVDGTTDINLGSGALLRFLSVGAADTTDTLYVRGRPNQTISSENDLSITALITYGGFDFYVGSDAEGINEKAVDDVVMGLGRHVDVLHVDHHGSDTYGISSPEFLGNMGPEVALISVWSNSFGHPRATTVTNIQAVVEHLPQRIIRLSPGDTGNPDWAPENMSYCHTTNGHLTITANGSTYTVSGNGITEPGLTNHSTDDAGGPTPTPTATATGPTPTPTRTPTPSPTPTAGSSSVVVNQVGPFSVAGGGVGEYVELYNNGTSAVNLNGWKLDVYSGDYTFTASDVIPGRGFYLIADTNPAGGVTPDVFTDIGVTDNGASSYAQLLNASAQVVDKVGWATSTIYEGTRLGTLTSGKAWKRTTDGADTDNNSADFSDVACNPRNSSYGLPTATPTRTPTRTATPTITPTLTPAGTPTPTPTQLPTQVFFDDFLTGTIDTGKWTYNTGAAESNTDGAGEPSGTYSLNLDGRTSGGDEIRSKVLNLSGYGAATLSYSWERTGNGNSPEPNEDLWVDYWNGSSWVNLAQYLGSGDDMTSYQVEIISLPPGALHSGFQIRFRNLGTASSSTSFDDWFVDDVEIRAAGPTPTPTSTPTPTITPTPTPWDFPMRVNFQPTAAPPVEGYTVDDGSDYSTHGEYSYGWQ